MRQGCLDSPEALKPLGNHLSVLNTNMLPKTCSRNGGERFTKSLGILSKYFGCKARKVSVYGK